MKRLETAANLLLALAAVTVAVVVVHREWASPRRPELLPSRLEPRLVEGWEAMLPFGPGFGPEEAAIQVIVFSDMECPFCARWHTEVFQEIQARFGEVVRFTLMHLPIPGHRFSRQGAVALECASAQDRFREFLEVIYASQDSIGLKPWASFAEDAAVPDPAAFEACTKGPEPVRIQAGLEWRERLGIDSTPTVLVNGWLFPRPPGKDEMGSAVEALLAGNAPAPGT